MFSFVYKFTGKMVARVVIVSLLFTLLSLDVSLATVAAAQIERCCPLAGCFNNSKPFGWPFPLPQCAEDMDISMKVFTRHNAEIGQSMDRVNIPSTFNGTRMTIFIVHGWMNSVRSPWLYRMKDALLASNDCNVVVVSWDLGADVLWYPQAAANTRSVGVEIGLVAENLVSKGGSTRSRLYCIGHSLGAHVCGHAGQRMKFGRITGLDPAGPLFEHRDWTVGLNPNCADFVDVMHTGGRILGFGTLKVLGHVDMYPNGGRTQPCCFFKLSSAAAEEVNFPYYDQDSTYFDWSREKVDRRIKRALWIDCSHEVALDYFIESIRTPCFLARYVCTNPYKALKEFCKFKTNPVQSMGFNSDNYPARGCFYLDVNKKSPFCVS